MKDKWARIIGIPFLGLLTPAILRLMGSKSGTPFVISFLVTALITFLIWEVSRKVIFYLREKFPWNQYHMKHLLLEIPILFSYSTLVIIGVLWIMEMAFGLLFNSRGLVFGIYNGIILTFLIVSIYEGHYFFSRWKQSYVEAERYKKNHIQAQYEALKSHVNPHFLFNSLSVLSSLVEKDSKMAVHFIERLSKVYRYVLDSRNLELIPLKTEIEFISSYSFLMQTRFGKSFIMEINVPGTVQERSYIPPLTLQMLVENAIKHNEISENKPLKLEVYMEEEGWLSVRNGYNPLRNRNQGSAGTGLNNISNQYLHVCNQNIRVKESQEEFKVELPLIPDIR